MTDTGISTPSAPRQAPANPFDPDDDRAYRAWRERKLADFPARAEDLIVEVNDPRALSEREHAELLRRVRRANMAIYASRVTDAADKDIPRRLGAQFGLTRLDSNLLADEDAVTSITVTPGKSGRGYIPYSNRRLLWHTDGYYNTAAQRVRAFVLHCVAPAAVGGENGLLDHEIAYIRLRDENPDHIRALMAPDAMTIPANEESGENRAAVSGPVFSVDTGTGALHMRYTARTRSIVWKDDAPTRAAVQALARLLADDSPDVFRFRLAAGQGLLNNNVLHNRTEFRDGAGANERRLIYRARYYDRIRGTGARDV